MKVYKNEKGGVTLDGTDTFVLVVGKNFIDADIGDNIHITKFNVMVYAKRQKIKALFKVIKWLFSK